MYAWGFVIGCILLFTGSLADNWQWGGRAFKRQFMVNWYMQLVGMELNN